LAVTPKSQLPHRAAGYQSLDIQPQHVGGYPPRGVMQQPTKSGDALRPIRFGVNHRALIQRINRVLKASNEQLKAVGELGAVIGAGKQCPRYRRAGVTKLRAIADALNERGIPTARGGQWQAVNHVSGHKAGIAGVYNRAAYEKEKRTALAMWADHVMAAVEGRASNVVPLRA
jgi:hypothetical protein